MEHDSSHSKAQTHLQEFLKSSHHRLQNILDQLQWSKDKVLKNFNTNSAASDVKAKIPRKAEAADGAKSFPPSCNNTNSVVLNTQDLQNLLDNNPSIQAPQNFNELQANFSREQKLKIYEYVIANTKKMTVETAEEIQDSSLQSFSKILAQKRREKQKKRKHRVSKPTQNEEIRALIDLQMQALEQYLRQKSTDSMSIVPANHCKKFSLHEVKGNSSSAGFNRECINKSSTKINSNANNRSTNLTYKKTGTKRRSQSPISQFGNFKAVLKEKKRKIENEEDFQDNNQTFNNRNHKSRRKLSGRSSISTHQIKSKAENEDNYHSASTASMQHKKKKKEKHKHKHKKKRREN